MAGPAAGERLTLIEGAVADAPGGPFDAATCSLKLLVPDDGSKLALLRETRRRLRTGAPFILIDQCIDRAAPDVERRLARYAAYAVRSGVEAATVANARAAVAALDSMVPDRRNEELLREAGFRDAEVFYLAITWRGWVAYA